MKRFAILGLVLVLVLAFASMGVAYKWPWPPPPPHPPANIICVPDDYPTIQDAIDAAAGTTIVVRKGTYTEQVTINKSLTLIGSGASSTTIQAPATLTGDADGYKNIVTISGSGVNVEFTGFTVSGPGTATGGSINTGIRVRDSAYANIHHNNIVHIRNDPLIGSYQEVFGILVGCCYWTGPDRTGTATIAYNTITDYQKGGIEVGGTGSSATIKNNTITGIGQTDILAAYGICVSRYAVANIIGNLIEDNDYYADGKAGQGILTLSYIYTGVPSGSPMVIKDNEIRNNCQGISIFGPGQDALIEGNSIHDNVQYGVFLAGTSSVNVNNTMIRGNDILNNGTDRNPPYDAGILVLDTMVGTGNVAHHNNIVGNYRGVNVIQSPGNPNPPDTFDAENNWWGSASGPTHTSNTYTVPAGDPQGDAVSDKVDYCPWLDAAYRRGKSFAPVVNTDTGEGFSSIQAAIDAAAGTTITCAAGTYNESVNINKDNLTICGYGSRPAITGGLKFDTDLTGLTLKNFYVTGDAVPGKNSIVRMLGTITDLTIDNCVFDGENVPDRHGFTGGQLEGDVTITNSEFVDILGWAVLDSRSGSGGDGSAMGIVTFVNNKVHDCNGTVVFRGLSTDWTDNVYICKNTFENIGEAGVSDHWAAFEVNRADNVKIHDNQIRNVVECSWGEGQAMQLWQVGKVDIESNTIENNYMGIYILKYPAAYDISNISVHRNSFTGNDNFALSVEDGLTGGPLDATRNWWGHRSGPSGVGPGSGDAVSDYVDFDPWLKRPVRPWPLWP